MQIRGSILLSLVLTTATLADVPAATMPALTVWSVTAPTAAEMPGWIARLGSRDPADRANARATLMMISRADLPALADAARNLNTLLPTQKSLLKEIAVQVYLAGQHNFEGVGVGYLGITLAAANQEPNALGAVVMDRLPGYDSIRQLQFGDVIVSVAPPADHVVPFKPVLNFQNLRDVVGPTTPGDWIALMIRRDGVEHQIHVRVGPVPPDEANAMNPPLRELWVQKQYAEGEKYWRKTFEPRMLGRSTSGPTTAPTTRPAR